MQTHKGDENRRIFLGHRAKVNELVCLVTTEEGEEGEEDEALVTPETPFLHSDEGGKS